MPGVHPRPQLARLVAGSGHGPGSELADRVPPFLALGVDVAEQEALRAGGCCADREATNEAGVARAGGQIVVQPVPFFGSFQGSYAAVIEHQLCHRFPTLSAYVSCPAGVRQTGRVRRVSGGFCTSRDADMMGIEWADSQALYGL